MHGHWLRQDGVQDHDAEGPGLSNTLAAEVPGAWSQPLGTVETAWTAQPPKFKALCRAPGLEKVNHMQRLGTPGTDSHSIEGGMVEVCHHWFNCLRKLLVRYERLKRKYF